MQGEWWVMPRSVSRSALLTKFLNVSEEMETVVGFEGLSVSRESLSHWMGWCRIGIKTNKHTNISNRCHTESIRVDSRFPWLELQHRQSLKKSNTVWPLEWQNSTFMMSPRLFPEIDGLSRNIDWLIHRLTECAPAVRLLSCSLSGQNIQPDTVKRMTNEWCWGKLCPGLPARVSAIAGKNYKISHY